MSKNIPILCLCDHDAGIFEQKVGVMTDATDRTLAELGAMVRDRRKAKGLTQAEFAEVLGIDRPYLVHLESGRGTKHLVRLIEALNLLGVDLIARPRS